MGVRRGLAAMVALAVLAVPLLGVVPASAATDVRPAKATGATENAVEIPNEIFLPGAGIEHPLCTIKWDKLRITVIPPTVTIINFVFKCPNLAPAPRNR